MVDLGVQGERPTYQLQRELSDADFAALRRTRLPAPAGEHLLSPTIEAASRERLEADLASLLALIESLAEQEGFELDDDGIPYDWPAVQRRAETGGGNNARALIRHSRTVAAIRRELDQRQAATREKARRETEDADAALRSLVANAPTYAAEIVELAERVAEAWRIAGPVLESIALIGAVVPDLERRYATLREGARIAGSALGEPVPVFPPMPELPDIERAQELVAQIVLGRFGKDGYFRTIEPRKTCAHRAGDLAERVRRAREFGEH